MTNETTEADRHLTDAELFALAAPASGEPEALPKHLSTCRACSRALLDWKGAVRALAEKDAGEIGRRTEDEWRAAEDATLERLKKAAPARRRVHPLRWAAAIAASLLVAVLLLPSKRPPVNAASAPATPIATSSSASELSPADQADDDLLRQASFLAAGGDLEGESGLAGRL
jgi:hypothetical protein